MDMRRVVVTIDRLVLKGFRFEDRHAIAQGLQEQLTQLLAEPGMAQQIGAVGSMSHLRVNVGWPSGTARAQQVGQATARAIGGHWAPDRGGTMAVQPTQPRQDARR